MMKIRAIIVEDELAAKSMLSILIERYCPEVQIVGDASTVKEGVELIEQLLPDLVFLDIEMPGEKGLFLFKYFDKIDFEVIFTTAYNEYAINAIRLSALDYLLKPISLEELKISIQEFKKRQNNKQLHHSLFQQLTSPIPTPKRIVLPFQNSFIFLEVDEIMYCRADGAATLFVTQKGERHTIAKLMKEYADLLESLGFIRVHRSAIINLDYVQEFIRKRPHSVVMKDGVQIAIAQSRKDYLMNKLLRL